MLLILPWVELHLRMAEEALEKIAALQPEWPDNIALQSFSSEYFESLETDEEKAALLLCLNSCLLWGLGWLLSPSSLYQQLSAVRGPRYRSASC